jgi:Na+-driven multidrug efflux pump
LTAFISTLYFFFNKKSFGKYNLAKCRFWNGKLIKELLQVGVPYTFQMFSDFCMAYVLNLLLGYLGKENLSASRVSEIVYLYPLILIIRWPTATSYLGGRAMKNNNQQLLKKFMYTNVIGLEILNAAWVGIAMIFSKGLINVFIDPNDANNERAIELANTMLWLYPIGLCAETIRYAVTGIMRGNKDTKSSMLNSLIWMLLLGIPAVGLAYYWGAGMSVLSAVRNVVLGGAAFSLSGVLKRGWSALFHASDTTKKLSGPAPSVLSRVCSGVKSCWASFWCHQKSSSSIIVTDEESTPILPSKSTAVKINESLAPVVKKN